MTGSAPCTIAAGSFPRMRTIWVLLLVALSWSSLAEGRRNRKVTRLCTPPCGPQAVCNRKNECQCKKDYIGNGDSCVGGCVCSAAGDPHYDQFDQSAVGNSIHFQGACKYLLSELKSTTRPECNLRIEVKNENRNGDLSVSYTRLVDIFIGNTTVSLGQGRSLQINGEKANLPYQDIDGKFQVKFLNVYAVFTSSCNVVVQFDGNHKVYVIMPKEFGNDLSGMCGNCNNDDSDDCQSRNGTLIERSKRGKCPGNVFGEEWRVPDETAIEGTCEVESFEEPCDDDSLALASDLKYCGYIDLSNTNGPIYKYLKDNNLLADPDVVKIAKADFEMCTYDVCRVMDTLGSATESACKLLESFVADLDLEAMVELPADILHSVCPPECGENEEWYEKKTCEKTCVDVLSGKSPDCQMDVLRGCGCSEGFVRSNTKCVPAVQCGCLHTDKKYYQLGETVVDKSCRREYTCERKGGRNQMRSKRIKPCLRRVATCTPVDGVFTCKCKKGMVGDGRNKCVRGCGPDNLQCHKDAYCDKSKRKDVPDTCRCKKGLDGDGIRSCQKSCTCLQSGDPHTTTYDGLKIHDQGRCTYVLSDVKFDHSCSIRVEVKNIGVPKRDVSVSRIMMIYVAGDVIRIEQKRIRYKNNVRLFADIDEEDGLPYTVTDAGKFVVVTNDCGMSAGFDGNNKGFVSIPSKYGELAKGLCGNCDGKKNDYVTSDNKDVSKDPNKYSEIGNSWIVTTADDYVEANCVVKQDSQPTCNRAQAKAGKRICAGLTNKKGPFKECLKTVAAEAATFQTDCEFDYCGNKDDRKRQREQVCSYYSQLSDLCVEKTPFTPMWRTKRFCPSTDECAASRNLKFSPVANTCQPSCVRPTKGRRCRTKLQEGCVCSKPGLLYDIQNDACVKRSQCGCSLSHRRERNKGGRGKSKGARGSSKNSLMRALRSLKQSYFPIGASVTVKGCKTRITCVHKKGRSLFKTKKLKGCKKNEKCKRSKNGDFQCECGRGYEKVKGKCQRSCKGNKCHKNARCTRKGCRCKGGFKGDGVKRCDSRGKRCECSASGDPHYRTFDSKRVLHFMGVCKYTLSENTDNRKGCAYHVMAQNERRNGKTYPSYTEYIIIKFKGDTVKLDQKGVFYVNSKRMKAPFKVTGKYKIVREGQFTSMETVCDQQFRFDGKSKAEIEVPKPAKPTYYIGLCGNCDGKDNDWKIRSGKDVSKIQPIKNRTIAFGEGWRVGDDSGLSPKECEIQAQQEEPKCPGRTRKAAQQNNMCGAMKSRDGPFRECLAEMDDDKDFIQQRDDLVNQCIQDVCLNADSPEQQEKTMCESMESMDELCMSKEIDVNWRSRNFCPMVCGERQVYVKNGGKCQETCSGVESCEETVIEDCVCQKGYVFSDNKCVERKKCGCEYTAKLGKSKATMYAELDDIITTNKCEKFKCTELKNGGRDMIRVGKKKCHRKARCLNVDGENMCVCRKGFVGNGYVCKRDDGTENLGDPKEEKPKSPPGKNPKSPPGKNPKSPPGKNPKSPPGKNPKSPPGKNPKSPPGKNPKTKGNKKKPPKPPGSGKKKNPKAPKGTKNPKGKNPKNPKDKKPSKTPKQPKSPKPSQKNPRGPKKQPTPAPPVVDPMIPPVEEQSEEPEPEILIPEEPEAPEPEEPEEEEPVEEEPVEEEPVEEEPVEEEPVEEEPVEEEPVEEEPVEEEPEENPPEPCVQEEKKEEPEPVLPPKPAEILECLPDNDPKGKNYWGHKSVTTSNRPCQRWRDINPHMHPYNRYLETEENYCRNRKYKTRPERDLPWCYTMDKNKEWEYCHIPKCPPENLPENETPPPPEPTEPPKEARGCYNQSDNGHGYTGPTNFAEDGSPCDFWAKNGYTNYGDVDNNCRNPESDETSVKPWCFVGGKHKYCGVDICDTPKEEDEINIECKVEQKVSMCMSITKLTGSCEQKFDYPGECKFSVLQKTKQKYLVFFTSDKESEELYIYGNKRHVSKTCGTFLAKDNEITIMTPLCGMCMRSAYNDIMPDENTPAVPGKNGFCKP